MENFIFDNTKQASYLLWENNRYISAIDLWHCSEDIAFYLELNTILEVSYFTRIIILGKSDLQYINLVREISYRLYSYTKVDNMNANWFVAEKLILNTAWCEAIVNVAKGFRAISNDKESTNGIRTDRIREYYRKNNLNIN